MQELPTIQSNSPTDLAPEEIRELSDEVRALAAERDAVVLAHNYQLPELQDVADYVGDSLGLSRKAAAGRIESIALTRLGLVRAEERSYLRLQPPKKG